MTSNIAVKTQTHIASVFQRWIDDPNTKLPDFIGAALTPLLPELGELSVIHPTTNDPVLISSKLGALVVWFKI